MFPESERRTLINYEPRPIEMNTSFCVLANCFWWRNRNQTFFATVTLHFVTNDFTYILYLIECEGSLIFIIYIHEEIVFFTLLLNNKEFFTLFDGFNVPLVEFIQFIKWHGKDTTVHEHM